MIERTGSNSVVLALVGYQRGQRKRVGNVCDQLKRSECERDDHFSAGFGETRNYEKAAAQAGLAAKPPAAVDEACSSVLASTRNFKRIGAESVFGVSTIIFETPETTLSDQTIQKITAWHAPALNCFAVRTQAIVKSADGPAAAQAFTLTDAAVKRLQRQDAEYLNLRNGTYKLDH